MYLNKAYIIGNLTRDPELKVLPSGMKVCSFAVATSRVYKDKEGVKKEMVDFHNVSAFSKLGELAGQYLKKGQQVLVEGRIQTRSWEVNGEKKYRTEIVADNIQFGMKSKTGVGESVKNEESSVSIGSDASADKIDYPQDEINPDDIPF